MSDTHEVAHSSGAKWGGADMSDGRGVAHLKAFGLLGNTPFTAQQRVRRVLKRGGQQPVLAADDTRTLA